jgi:hypothetical protein
MVRIILRGGPLTGQVRTLRATKAELRLTTKEGMSVTYEPTGRTDREEGLPIFVYRAPPGAPPSEG